MSIIDKKYKNYIPEFDYKSREYKPFGGPPVPDMCGNCKSYYNTLYHLGKVDSPNPPNCLGHLQDLIADVTKDIEDPDDQLEVALAMDPMAWANYHFGYSEDLWNPRWYQSFASQCTADQLLFRWGRRMGKSILMCIMLLHAAYTNKNYRIIIAGPQERHVQKLFEELHKYISASAEINASKESSTKNPFQITFKNGSTISGFSIGAQQSDAGTKVRGQDAHLIVIDEFDFIGDKEIDTLMAIKLSHPNVRLLVSTTPSGQRKKFYEYVTNKRTGWKEFWFISKELPHWTDELDKWYQDEYDDFTYDHEILAEFGESSSGVFKGRLIDSSLMEYDMDKSYPVQGVDYVLGVDWNKTHGTHMVIIQVHDGKMTLVKKIVIPESEYMQTAAVNKIIELNDQWNFKYLFLDAGYGTVQAEELKKWGMAHPSTGLHMKTVPIPMQMKIDVINPVTSQPESKFAKPFLVQQTAKLLEDGRLILPVSEDTSITKSTQVQGVVQQMRNYQIISVSVHGLPQYTKEGEHTLTAYMLACGGWIMKEGPFSKHDQVLQMITSTFPGISEMNIPKKNPDGTIAKEDYDKLVSMVKENNIYSPNPTDRPPGRASSFGGRGTINSPANRANINSFNRKDLNKGFRRKSF